MLEYSKLILTKVSFDPLLFEKEYRKALQLLPQEEVVILYRWARRNYGKQYKRIVEGAFRLKKGGAH